MLTRKLLSASLVVALTLSSALPAEACHRRRCRACVPCRPVACVPVWPTSPVYAVPTPQGYAAPQAQPVSGATDVHGFCAWLNSFRARHGRGPVAVDGNLCRDAAVNSSYGFGHAYLGSARRQNAAQGTLATAQAGWVNSPAHLSALLDPSISRIGLAQVGSVITFSAN